MSTCGCFSASARAFGGGEAPHTPHRARRRRRWAAQRASEFGGGKTAACSGIGRGDQREGGPGSPTGPRGPARTEPAGKNRAAAERRGVVAPVDVGEAPGRAKSWDEDDCTVEAGSPRGTSTGRFGGRSAPQWRQELAWKRLPTTMFSGPQPCIRASRSRNACAVGFGVEVQPAVHRRLGRGEHLRRGRW
jgi:hypothetical protein